ncbi:NAD binding Rossmann fold oxidoreductase [Xylona heveae TC161]|uniref:NAD binding Rossmann fold oxidoreductase n=1 Tax=Xylona heveae (strain CBS 132557 / TC161) TaxID=1328760 RepID=A0A164ZHA9_XYLHT|nr:NAD binding Rossmann fold oxidoreductase [Xylona heveae TC161]KZF19103.1 NAD binding Rossmann fold oxidoreductase [Xylona heveae TC161]
MAPNTFNVGVVGYGMSAKVFHIPLITSLPELKLYAIVQRHPKPEDDAEKDHPGIKSYRSTEELVKDPAVDVVVITTVPETHYSLASLALEAGKHVVIEKPVTSTSEEADKLIALAKEKKLLLTVYQNRRWDADFATLTHLIKSGALGRVVEFESHFDRFRPEAPSTGSWKTQAGPASGAIYDLGVHLLDQVVFALGLPKKITGFVGIQRQGETGGFEDACTVLLHYDGGVMATVKASVISPEEKQLRFWVRGDKGSYKKYHMDVQEDQLKAGKKPGDSGFALEPKENYGVLTSAKDGKIVSEAYPTIDPPTYVEFYRQLAQALSGQGDVPVKPEQSRNIIKLIELAKESSREGQTLPAKL